MGEYHKRRSLWRRRVGVCEEVFTQQLQSNA
nr:MAG TPA: hypothetical protein [Caudoviricetes sp.]